MDSKLTTKNSTAQHHIISGLKSYERITISPLCVPADGAKEIKSNEKVSATNRITM